jgi:hypothetical protein
VTQCDPHPWVRYIKRPRKRDMLETKQDRGAYIPVIREDGENHTNRHESTHFMPILHGEGEGIGKGTLHRA